MSSAKRVLITGVNGFIGAHSAMLLHEDFIVAGIGRQERTYLPIEYHCLPPTGPDFLDFLSAFRPDLVLHAAGSASVFRSITQPAADFAAGPELVMQLYESIRTTELRPFVVLLSSAAVYGDPPSLPVGEDTPLHPLSPYGWHKHMGELVGREYANMNGIPGVALRVFSCYGEGQKKLLMWDACTKLVTGKAEFFGTGEETRDYIHVADLARFIMHLFQNPPTQGFGMVNAASGTSVRVREVIERLAQVMGCQKTELHFNGENRTGDPRFWQADISAMKSLGFTPLIPLDIGIRDYARWFMAIRRKS